MIGAIFTNRGRYCSCENYITGHKNEATGQFEGMPANVELYVFAPQFKRLISVFALHLIQKHTASCEKKSASLSYQCWCRSLALLSQIRATVSNTAGEVDNSVMYPTADIRCQVSYPVVGNYMAMTHEQYLDAAVKCYPWISLEESFK
ncbi:hypothetical protein [Pasteurella multocida]|uniref:hypothetical protein n=1 Tax=Pasteurella multocida TaxID=747 RepID=UPI001D11D9BC|nr:hypothetical protein [Pasteurella multocida]